MKFSALSLFQAIYSFVFLFASMISISLRAQYNTPEKKANFYFELCKKYEPASLEILKSEEPEKFLVYAGSGETAKELLDNFGTVVHETCHSYNFKIGTNAGWVYDGFFISENCKIAARKGKFFPSSVLNDVIPKEQQEKIYRYKTYVSGASSNSSSLEGLYGFINEFSAYYHGSKADLDLLPYYEKVCPYTNARCWVEGYLSQVQSTLSAYYEFRLFIAWYLIYAEQHEAKIFDELITNQNLRLSFTLLEIEFNNLLEDYFAKRKNVVAKLNAAGNTIKVDDEYIQIVEGHSSSGTGIPDDEIAYMQTLYTAKENAMLEKFRVKGATLSNYKIFLEKIK